MFHIHVVLFTYIFKITVISTVYRSLGCTIHEMATTKPPWGELPPEAAMFQIGIGQTVPGLPDHLPSQLKDVFNQCLSRLIFIYYHACSRS